MCIIFQIVVLTKSGEELERLSPWATYVVQPPENEGYVFKQRAWNPAVKYQFKEKKVPKPKSLRVYECHVGISSSEPEIGSYKYFAQKVIPRIAKLGTVCVVITINVFKFNY